MSATSRQGPRLLIACLIAPVTTGIVLLCISLFGNVGEGIWALKLSAMVGYPALVILGLPAYLVFRRLNWVTIWPYLIIGVIIGMIVPAVIYFPGASLSKLASPSRNASLEPAVAMFALAAFFGGLSSCVFWLIARPDRKSSQT
jgi:hypothetical protein